MFDHFVAVGADKGDSFRSNIVAGTCRNLQNLPCSFLGMEFLEVRSIPHFTKYMFLSWSVVRPIPQFTKDTSTLILKRMIPEQSHSKLTGLRDKRLSRSCFQLRTYRVSLKSKRFLLGLGMKS